MKTQVRRMKIQFPPFRFLLVMMTLSLTAACSSDKAADGAGATDANAPGQDVGLGASGGADGDASGPGDSGDGGTTTGPGGADASPGDAKPSGGDEKLTALVNPFVGTGGKGYGQGSALPGAGLPFGMVKISPDTMGETGALGFSHCGGYWYEDRYIQGFSHVHIHGTGVADHGNILFMPLVGMSERKTVRTGYRSSFSHNDEHAEPGYYSVILRNGSILAELTATTRTAFHRYTFPEGTREPVVLINASHVLGENECLGAQVILDPGNGIVRGWMHNNGSYSGRFGGFKVYFHAQFSRPFASSGVINKGAMRPNTVELQGVGPDTQVGAWVQFDPAGGPVIEAKVGISYVSMENAAANLRAEAEKQSFDDARKSASGAWEKELRGAEARGGKKDDRSRYYTALYHAMQMPQTYSDSNGEYLGFDRQVHKAEGFTYYSDFSLWDTYRTQHPWLILTQPARQTDMVRSLIAMAEQGGTLPRWPMANGYTGGMLGDCASVVIAESMVKGLTGFDFEKAYAFMRLTAMGPPPKPGVDGREGVEDFIKLGYVAQDRNGGSVSLTQEYSINDNALAAAAAFLKKTDDADMFAKRALNHRNLYHKESGFFIGRRADGTFETDFDPIKWERFYVEGNSWQYLWLAPHDITGMSGLMGGRTGMIARLDEFFGKSKDYEAKGLGHLVVKPYYWHGNEPGLHTSYFYSLLGEAGKAADTLRWVRDMAYGMGPDGLPGNDDAGTLSAWLLFSDLGFYPNAGTSQYFIGAPLLEEADLNTGKGVLKIRAPGASRERRFVKSVTINGKPWTSPVFDHGEIAAGGEILFEMSDKPHAWAQPLAP
ncbi:MAG: hypothetical protein GMKNLPBB_02091 [Myxococcota bacterium]|nr:hypothetical protein [Myxococcota bacterium]